MAIEIMQSTGSLLLLWLASSIIIAYFFTSSQEENEIHLIEDIKQILKERDNA